MARQRRDGRSPRRGGYQPPTIPSAAQYANLPVGDGASTSRSPPCAGQYANLPVGDGASTSRSPPTWDNTRISLIGDGASTSRSPLYAAQYTHLPVGTGGLAAARSRNGSCVINAIHSRSAASLPRRSVSPAILQPFRSAFGFAWLSRCTYRANTSLAHPHSSPPLYYYTIYTKKIVAFINGNFGNKML